MADLKTTLVVGALYEHYKGNKYQLIGLARHSETLEDLVVYRALYGDYGMWVRPARMFEEYIILNGVQVPRFRLVV